MKKRFLPTQQTKNGLCLIWYIRYFIYQSFFLDFWWSKVLILSVQPFWKRKVIFKHDILRVVWNYNLGHFHVHVEVIFDGPDNADTKWFLLDMLCIGIVLVKLLFVISETSSVDFGISVSLWIACWWQSQDVYEILCQYFLNVSR